jgi:hypothetical protein
MGLFDSLFSKKKEINSYESFWIWFKSNEKAFNNVVRQQGDIENAFLDKLSSKLNEIKSGYFFLVGLLDEHTVELIVTADGDVKNIVFVEELVQAAPALEGWKFTALKPAMDIDNLGINLGGFEFTADKLSFYPNQVIGCPDEIDITVVHEDYNQENDSAITNGVYIFLDNYLGELEFACNVDNLQVAAVAEINTELIPISKLKDYLNWRQKEFIEKYEGVSYNAQTASYSMLEGTLKSGNKLLAVINTEVINWDHKASHPWILDVEISYNGEDNNGMPDKATYQLLDEFEDRILAELQDSHGYLNIGRETADNTRNIYFACKEFRKPSKLLHQLQQEYAGKLNTTYRIFKDKYWKVFDRFKQN